MIHTCTRSIRDTLAMAIRFGSVSPGMLQYIVLDLPASSGSVLPDFNLLHGYSKNEQVWLEIRPDLPRLASFHDMIIVCPDGRNSWYFNSPVDSTS